MSGAPLAAPGLNALMVERAARKSADRARREAEGALQEVADRAELWELRAKENGRSVKHFKAEAQRFKELYEQARINNNIYAD